MTFFLVDLIGCFFVSVCVSSQTKKSLQVWINEQVAKITNIFLYALFLFVVFIK